MGSGTFLSHSLSLSLSLEGANVSFAPLWISHCVPWQPDGGTIMNIS